MTNSTPKNSKIARQGSPNTQGKSKRTSNFVKTVTYFSSGSSSSSSSNSSSSSMSSNSSSSSNNNSNSSNNNNGSSGAGKSTVPSCAGAGKNTVQSSAGGRHNSRSSNGGGRQSCSPPRSSAKNVPRNSPNRFDSSRGSPTNSFYAGAKFSEPPSPASLPKPPSHWTGLMVGCGSETINGSCHFSQHFKMLVNVHA